MKTIIVKLCLAAAVAGCALQSEAGLTWSASPNAAIPDNSPNAGAAADIYIAPGDSQLSGMVNPTVSQVASVRFTIAGGWDGDYRVVLSHTGGTTSQSVVLLNVLLSGAAANGGFNNVILTTLNSPADISTGASASSTAAIRGTYSPQGGVNFDAFQNISPTGDWLLYVTDNAAGDRGTLASWSLTLDVVPEPTGRALMIFGAMLAALAAVRWFCRQRNPAV
jgi:hypothetical protein